MRHHQSNYKSHKLARFYDRKGIHQALIQGEESDLPPPRRFGIAVVPRDRGVCGMGCCAALGQVARSGRAHAAPSTRRATSHSKAARRAPRAAAPTSPSSSTTARKGSAAWRVRPATTATAASEPELRKEQVCTCFPRKVVRVAPAALTGRAQRSCAACSGQQRREKPDFERREPPSLELDLL